MANSTYGTDGLLATTLKHYVPRIEDNVFTSKPLLWAIREAGRIVNQDGGEKIVQPLIYAEAANKGSYEDDDVFTTNANTGISAAEFPWKQYYGLVHFTGIELAKNKGKSALLNLMQTRMEQVEMTIAEQMETMLFGDGSGNGNKDWYGLAAIVDSADPSWGDLGGIDRATYDYWKATETAHGGALTLAGLRTLYNTVSEGNDHPTNIFSKQGGLEAYEALLQTNQRFEDSKMADGGFQNLMFKGAPWAFSSNNTTQVVYMVNMKYLTLYKLSNVWFKPSDLLQPTNQDAFYKTLLCYGNFVPSNCKRHGKLTGVTDAT